MRIPFDVIGSREKAVAIIEVPEGEERTAADEILGRYKHIKSVLAKQGGRQGTFRTCKYKLVAGSKNTEVVHRESGYLIRLDPQVVYFSPRESEERKRIAEMVRPGENVLVMFSGVGPFAIAIAKKQPKCSVVCMELNPKAVEYADKNVKLNKLTNVRNYCMDAGKAAEIGRFDRILMPLPETAFEFLDAARAAAKPGAVIHLYGISGQEEKFTDLQAKAKGFRVVGSQRVLPFAPRKYKVRLDLAVPSDQIRSG